MMHKSQFKNRNFESRKKGKRAQVTLFVIIALAIVVGVVTFFSLQKVLKPIGRELTSKESFESCINNQVSIIDSLLLRQGGISNPKHYLFYQGFKASYLCYTEEYAKPCINQQPLLKEHIEKELAALSYANISYCINKEKTNLLNKGYSQENIKFSEFRKDDISVKLLLGKILVNLNLSLTTIKEEKSEKIDGFKTTVKSPAYEYAFLAGKIINSEIADADFNNALYTFLNRNMFVDKIRSNDYILYQLKNRNSDKVFIFLIRNYAIPPGV